MKFFGFLFFFTTITVFGFAQSFTPAHLKAAGEVIEATGIKENFDTMVENVSASQAKLLPAENRETFVVVMKEFIAKYFNYEILKPKLELLYAAEFSEVELLEISKFYKTNTGKKLASKLSILQQKGSEMGFQAVQENKAELQRMMSEAFNQK